MSTRNAAKSVALITAVSFGLATGALAGDKDKPKEFSGGVYSPAKGIVCDRNAGFCADGTGISMAFTEEYLGHDAMQKFSKQIEGGRFDPTVFVMSNGVKCEVSKQKCFKSKTSNEVAEGITKRLFR